MVLFRKLLFWLHLTVGIAMGAVVFVMSVTGLALTYEKQMLRWADGFEARPPAPGAERMGPEALLARAAAAGGPAPSGVRYLADPTGPVYLQFGRESRAVNPYTGAALGEGATGMRSFFRTMIAWHRWLGQEGEGRETGKAITGASNLGFLFLIVTGAYLWWPKRLTWKHLRPILWFRGGLAGKARDFNWHNTAGFWALIPLFFVVATAPFFSYAWPGELLYRFTGEAPPAARGPAAPPSRERKDDPPPPPSFAGMDAAWTHARTFEPDWLAIAMSVPPAGKETVGVTIERGHAGRPDLRTSYEIHSSTGEIARRQTFADMGQAQQLRSWIRWIHTGEAGGWIGQTIAGVASAAACLLVYTGWMLSWRRFRAWQARREGVQ